MTSELDGDPAAGAASSASHSDSVPVSGEIPDAVSDHPEANGNVRINFVIERLRVASREGRVRKADVECIGEYCWERVSLEGMCLFLVKKTMSFLNDPLQLLHHLKLILYILEDDCDKIVASFHGHLMKHVRARRNDIMKRANSAITAEMAVSATEASNASNHPPNTSTSNDADGDTESKASDEGRVDPEKQAMQAEIDTLKLQLHANFPFFFLRL